MAAHHATMTDDQYGATADQSHPGAAKIIYHSARSEQVVKSNSTWLMNHE